MENNRTRRFFLKTIAFSAVTVLIAPFTKLKPAFASPPTQTVNMADPLVKALGYMNVANAERDLKSNNKALRAAAQAALKDRKDKKAYCHNCQFYGDSTGRASTAHCQLMPIGDVVSQGWCHSYSARPVAKPAGKSAAKKA